MAARITQHVLSMIRKKYFSLLHFLEQYPHVFLITLCAKNEVISLVPETSRKLRAPSTSSDRSSLETKRPPARCLHVGNVGAKATLEDLWREFEAFGTVEDVKIVHQGGSDAVRR